MRFILIVEDTPKGIRVKAAYNGNDITDHLAESIAAKTISNWAQTLKELEDRGLLFVEKE